MATEPGIFYKIKQASTDKIFLEALTDGAGATCESCIRCPWMVMNGLRNLAATLDAGENEIVADEAISKKVVISLKRMMDSANERGISKKGKGNA